MRENLTTLVGVVWSHSSASDAGGSRTRGRLLSFMGAMSFRDFVSIAAKMSASLESSQRKVESLESVGWIS